MQRIYLITLVLFTYLVSADEYREKIQPIFNNRCIACHSCFDGPCQLNLQSYEGFERGAHKDNVYNPTRLTSVHPTRLGIDAKTVDEWRKLNFFNLNTSKNLEDNIFYQMFRNKPIIPRELPTKSVEESMSCMNDVKTVKKVLALSDDLKMPYGLLPISETEKLVLGNWLENGAKGPTSTIKISDKVKDEIKDWEVFLNGKSTKEKLVSRYIYEHLFLGHIYFNQEPRNFYRLVRSKIKCEYGIDEIATRRPNDNPMYNEFYYCLKPLDVSIVAKTHLPFLFSKDVLEKTKKIFFGKPWNINPNFKMEDSYTNTIAENPFLAFKEIPPKARYEFLLEHAHFIVGTFIKGPVCNGSNALNSIQEQFYVYFLNPESGFLTKDNSVDDKTLELLMLPGAFGSDVKLTETWKLANILMTKREEYRKKKVEWLEKNIPLGYDYTDLWNGDKKNQNALLTVFRHDDNAVVLKGLHGDLPKTIFVLDYSLMERLVYNLVVNFDVFGNLFHQTLTRVYMDYIRMEAEENFLLFMPVDERLKMRKEWYKGIFTDVKMSYQFPLLIKNHPTPIKYKNKRNAKLEFVETTLKDYFTPQVIGRLDPINFKKITMANEEKLADFEKPIHELASNHPKGKMRYPNFFPESSFLIVEKTNGEKEVYTIIKNREHENISWVLGESLRLAPEEDTLTFVKGFYSFYPNYFFVVNERDLVEFKENVFKLASKTDYKEFEKKYGMSRTSEKFWPLYDQLNKIFLEEDGVNFGYLDLTRYFMQ